MESKEKINELNEKFKTVSDKIKDSTETLIISSMYAKDELDNKLKKTKENLSETQENIKQLNKKGKDKISSKLSKIQEELKEAKKNIEIKKEEKSKEKIEKYIDSKIDYAEDALALSLLAAQEAKIAFLEAVKAQADYDELYGKEEK